MKKVILACVITLCLFFVMACSNKEKNPSTSNPTNTPEAKSVVSLPQSIAGQGITIHYPEGWDDMSQEGMAAVHKGDEATFWATRAAGAGIAFSFINDDMIKNYAESNFSDVEITNTEKKKVGSNDGIWINMNANNAGTPVQVDCVLLKNGSDLIVLFASAKPELYSKYSETFASMLESVEVGS